jgi:hypothetical protein
MVDVKNRKCPCGKHASFGVDGGGAVACKGCKMDGMVYVNNRKKCPCGKHMIFGVPGGAAIACASCRTEEMVDVVSRLCPCGSRPSWGKLCSPCYAEAHPDDPLVLAHNKTETKLKLFFNELGANITATSTFNAMNVRGRRAPAWLGAREMDFSLFGGRLNPECDGAQHKTDVKRFRSLAVEQQALDCETTILKLRHGVSVQRIDQSDVWLDNFDWRAVLKVMLLFGLERAVAGAPVLICARRNEADTSYAPFLDLMMEPEHADSVYEMFLCEPGLVTSIHRATGARTYWKVPETLSLAALPDGLELAPGAPRQLTVEQAFKRHKAG